jgi:hypothetical protein
MSTPISNYPNALWNDFKTKFLSVADKHAPIRQRRVKSEYKSWLTNQIKRMSYYRDYLKRQSIKLGSTLTYDKAYKRCKNKLNDLISNGKNSKESWQTINELLNKRSKTTQIKQLMIINDLRQIINEIWTNSGCSSAICKLKVYLGLLHVSPVLSIYS